MPDIDPCSRILRMADGSAVGLAEYGASDGLPVLALHGAPASRLMFAIADQAARAAGLRLIAPDRPGYGLTPPDAQPTLASRTDWLIAIADALGLDRFAVLGISGGAPYATALACRLSRRVSALALVSPMGPVADLLTLPGHDKRAVPFLQRRFFVHLPRRWFFPLLGRLAVHVYMTTRNTSLANVPRLIGDPDAGVLDQPKVREAMVAMTHEALRNGAMGGINDMRVFCRPWGVESRDIAAPAVLWQGTADRIVPIAAALHLARSIPGCRLVTLDGAGHFWVFDHLDEICQSIRTMIRG